MKISMLLTMGISLLISIVSAYCTIIGMGKIFASAAYVTMGIASVIEIGRVVLLYDLHHYWSSMKISQRIPGIGMLLIAMTLSAMGVYGFFANAHSQRTQEIIPIEMEIKQKEAEISILNRAIEVNDEQLKQFDGKAFEKYTEMGYVTKAVNLQKEQQKVTNKLYDDNREKQKEITKLNQEILILKLDAEKKAPTLAHLKYYAKLFHVDDETAIIIFIVMIMLVFDTLAMYLMITADWIGKIDEPIVGRKNEPKNDDEFHKLESLIKDLTNDIKNNSKVDYDKLNYNKLSNDEVKQLLEDKLNPLTHMIKKEFININNKSNNQELVKKLEEISKKINNNIETNRGDEVVLNKIMDSIDINENVIFTNKFAELIDEHPNLLKELKQHYKNVESVINKLNKI